MHETVRTAMGGHCPDNGVARSFRASGHPCSVGGNNLGGLAAGERLRESDRTDDPDTHHDSRTLSFSGLTLSQTHGSHDVKPKLRMWSRVQTTGQPLPRNWTPNATFREPEAQPGLDGVRPLRRPLSSPGCRQSAHVSYGKQRASGAKAGAGVSAPRSGSAQIPLVREKSEAEVSHSGAPEALCLRTARKVHRQADVAS
jgi:hypothetical protein